MYKKGGYDKGGNYVQPGAENVECAGAEAIDERPEGKVVETNLDGQKICF